jgi:hypothetical protein
MPEKISDPVVNLGKRTVTFKAGKEKITYKIKTMRNVPWVGHYSKNTPEIYIDKSIRDPKQKSQLVVHEAVEKRRREKGIPIRKAHSSATRYERRYGKKYRINQREYERNINRAFRRNKPKYSKSVKSGRRFVRPRRRR